MYACTFLIEQAQNQIFCTVLTYTCSKFKYFSSCTVNQSSIDLWECEPKKNQLCEQFVSLILIKKKKRYCLDFLISPTYRSNVCDEWKSGFFFKEENLFGKLLNQ